MSDVPDYVRRASDEIRSYGSATVVTAELTAASTIRLIALLQLCSRHPNLSEDDHKFINAMVDNLQRGFKTEHTGIAELIRAGWNQELDVEVQA